MSESKVKEERQKKKIIHTLTIDELADGSLDITGIKPDIQQMLDYTRAVEDVMIGNALAAAMVVGEQRGYKKANEENQDQGKPMIIVP